MWRRWEREKIKGLKNGGKSEIAGKPIGRGELCTAENADSIKLPKLLLSSKRWGIHFLTRLITMDFEI